jgi:hypothetical protein
LTGLGATPVYGNLPFHILRAASRGWIKLKALSNPIGLIGLDKKGFISKTWSIFWPQTGFTFAENARGAILSHPSRFCDSVAAQHGESQGV